MTRFSLPALLVLLLASTPSWAADAEPSVAPKKAGTDVPAPERTKAVNPVYPPEALARGASAVVVVELIIDEKGKVAEAKVLHGEGPFGDAALEAVRQWEYKVTSVDGQPVRVTRVVPIRFAARLPDLKRDAGIPELRQGVAPTVPASGRDQTARVIAHVEVLADGHIKQKAIKSGESPWSEAVLAALDTWRFATRADDPTIRFDVRVDFRNGSVALDLTGVEPVEPGPGTAVVATPAPTSAPAAVAQSDAGVEPEAVAVATAAPDSPAPAATVVPPPVVEVVRSAPPAAAPAPAAGAGAVPAAPPVVENGLSSVRDVELAAGIPDLIRGRHPVAPPLARLGGLVGDVQVRFTIDSGGTTSVSEVEGPEELKAAAESLVRSWVFRRSAPHRVFALADVRYGAARVFAQIRPAP